jgi:hypothetical protein
MPGLLLRALVPIGFMPQFGPGPSVGLMLCPAYAPVPSMDISGMDMPMDMPMEVPRGVPQATTPGAPNHPTAPPPAGGMPSGDYQQHSLCPYAKSASLAPLPTVFNLPMAEQSATTLVLAAPQIAWFQIPARAQSPRAPPALA